MGKRRTPPPSQSVDVHGLDSASALRRVQQAIQTTRAAGKHRLRVIVGQGWGSPGGEPVLRPALETWLASEPAQRLYGVKGMRRDAFGGAIDIDIR